MTDLEQLRRMYRAVTGRDLEALRPSEVISRLQGGESGIVMVLTFDGQPDHQLVLMRIDEAGRVHFFNPWKPEGHAPGVEFDSPPRRVETDYLESVSAETFQSFFSQCGATCYSARV